MSDLISRQAAIDAIIADKIENGLPVITDTQGRDFEVFNSSCDRHAKILKELPSAESEIIRCEDCKWWDQKFDDSPMGYCMAAKHNYYSTHWEINILRTYGKNFFCADAEPKEEGEEDE